MGDERDNDDHHDFDDAVEAAQFDYAHHMAKADQIRTCMLLACVGGYSASTWLPAPFSYIAGGIFLLIAVSTVTWLGRFLRYDPTQHTDPYLHAVLQRVAADRMALRIERLGTFGIALFAVGLAATLLWPGPEAGALVPVSLGLLWITQTMYRRRNALLQSLAMKAEAT